MDIAKAYFLNPPSSVLARQHTGLMGLMDEAYLAHRLMEEVNDRFIVEAGVPLAPMDMTRSNIIVHHLIGEPFANDLDQAVLRSVEALIPKGQAFRKDVFLAYAEEHRTRGWARELEQWPCLASDLSITLRFEKGDSEDDSFKSTLH